MNITGAYGDEIFKDYEVDLDINFNTERMESVLPHKYSFQTFIETVDIKLTIDLFVYFAVLFVSLIFFAYISMTLGDYFKLIGSDYTTSQAWMNIMQLLKDKEAVDLTSADAIIVSSLYPDLKVIINDLSQYYNWSFIFVTLNALASFRTFSNKLFATFTDRPFKVTEITYLDTVIVLYYGFFVAIQIYYSDPDLIPEFYKTAGLVDTENNNQVFAVNMLWNSEERAFRFDYVMAIMAFLFMTKALF